MRAEGVERAKGGRGAVHGSGGGVVEVVVEVVVMVVVMMAVVVVVLGAHRGNWPINVDFLHDEMLHAEHLLEVPIGTADILSWWRRRWRWRHGSGGGFRWEANLVRLWRWDGVRGWRVPLPRQHVLRAHASCRGDRRNRMRAGERHNPHSSRPGGYANTSPQGERKRACSGREWVHEAPAGTVRGIHTHA